MTFAFPSQHCSAYRLQETAPPGEEPVSLAEFKAHARLSGTAEDADLTALLAAARLACETYAGLFFVTRPMSVFLDRWPDGGGQEGWWDGLREGVAGGAVALTLPVRPLTSIAGIYVYDAQGAAQEVPSTQYQVDVLGGRIAFFGQPPVAGSRLNGIEIRLTAGHGTAAQVPPVFKQAIKQVAAHLYAHRGDVAEQAMTRSGAAALLSPYRAGGL